jgi:prolyl 4-hydroxylase
MVPGSTPELLRWLDQRCRPVQEATLLQSLRDTGWSDAVARQALRRWCAGAVPRAPGCPADSGARPAPHPRCIDVGDRAVHVLMALAHPRVVLFGNLLSDECDAIMAAARPRMAALAHRGDPTGGEEINADRTSQGMFFQRGETPKWPGWSAHCQVAELAAGKRRGPAGAALRPRRRIQAAPRLLRPGRARHATIVRRGGQRVGTW